MIASVLVVIPARGGSKGIPRKNLVPVCNRPMISYAIQAALGADEVKRVIVTTDDEEIALISSRFGADIINRPKDLANDITTLDPVIIHAANAAKHQYGEQYDIVMTVQPTSPLVTSKDISEALAEFDTGEFDTVLSVVDDRHLCWSEHDGRPAPLYSARVNRQQLPARYKETGAIIACRTGQLATGSRIGEHVGLYIMPQERSFDIDTLADLHLCEALLSRRRIVFSVVGNKHDGLGHIYRSTMLAQEFARFEIHFVCEARDDLAVEFIQGRFYQLHVAENGERLKVINDLKPDLVINDILDTQVAHIQSLKESGAIVVNFEDLGPGIERADLVINALYTSQMTSEHIKTGYPYFCLRDEFIHIKERKESLNVARVLITFGGVDEGNLTARVLAVLAPACKAHNIAVDIVTGPGFEHTSEVIKTIDGDGLQNVNLVSSTQRISDYISNADLVITSGGRTVFEIASLRVPMIVISQNTRETTHTFASPENGIVNLGHRDKVTDEEIALAFDRMINSEESIRLMVNRLKVLDLKEGKKRVVKMITRLLEGDSN